MQVMILPSPPAPCPRPPYGTGLNVCRLLRQILSSLVFGPLVDQFQDYLIVPNDLLTHMSLGSDGVAGGRDALTINGR